MNWINTAGLIVVVLMLTPNMIFAFQNKDITNKCTNRLINIIEQIGRYGTIFFMIFHIGFAEYGFKLESSFAIWVIGTGILLVFYWGIWAFYFKKKNLCFAMLLAIIPSVLFIFSGMMFRNWLLVLFGIVFSLGHLTVTYQNHHIK